MNEVKVEKPMQETLEKMGVFSWPIWEKEVSCFDWYYGETEICYLLKGKVVVKTKGGQEIRFAAGDLVSFPKGLSCVWDIIEPVKKHYSFK